MQERSEAGENEKMVGNVILRVVRSGACGVQRDAEIHEGQGGSHEDEQHHGLFGSIEHGELAGQIPRENRFWMY